MHRLLTVVDEHEPAQYMYIYIYFVVVYTEAPDANWKSPLFRRQKLQRCVCFAPAVARAACTALCRRQTDRCRGHHSTVMTGGLDTAIRVCAQQREDPGSLSVYVCVRSARLLNHRNYFQRQPEHVEDKFMHHNRKKKERERQKSHPSIQLVPNFNINEILPGRAYHD